MSILPSFGLPTLPRPEPFDVGRPPYARSVQGLQDVCSHLEDWRFRGWTRAIFEVAADACPSVISGASTTPRLAPGPHNLTEVSRLVHHLRSDAAHLWVAVQYQAANDGTSSPEMDIQLYTLGGVLLDRGIRFSAAAGTMETRQKFDQALHLATSFVSSWVYPHLWLTTGVRVDDDARTAGTPGDPRLLSLDGASPRTRIEVRVTATSARVLAICAWEYPEALL